MNAREEKLLSRLEALNKCYDHAYVVVKEQEKFIKELKQENEDLKGQLKQFGLDNKPKSRGLFLK